MDRFNGPGPIQWTFQPIQWTFQPIQWTKTGTEFTFCKTATEAEVIMILTEPVFGMMMCCSRLFLESNLDAFCIREQGKTASAKQVHNPTRI